MNTSRQGANTHLPQLLSLRKSQRLVNGGTSCARHDWQIPAALLWIRFRPHRQNTAFPAGPVADLSSSSPLNQPGGAPVPASAYEVYSALYQAPVQEPLVFARRSVTDIPQVGGSCLKPGTPEEREMTDAFVAANRQSHRWEQKFTIPQGYRLLSPEETAPHFRMTETSARVCMRSIPGAMKSASQSPSGSGKPGRPFPIAGIVSSRHQGSDGPVSGASMAPRSAI